MKQATIPFAPIPLWRKRLPGYAAMGVATIALAVGLTTLQSARTTVPVPCCRCGGRGCSHLRHQRSVPAGRWQLAPWRALEEGFQSNVQAAVTIDARAMLPAVEMLSGRNRRPFSSQCVNPEFTSQYQGAAPFTLAGKNYTVRDPVTGAAYAVPGAAEEQPAAAGDFDPAQWRTFDTSPEAEATRKMYAGGAYPSGAEWKPLDDELAPPLDSSAEAWHGASCTQPCSTRAHWTASRWRSPLRISRQRSSLSCVSNRPT